MTDQLQPDFQPSLFPEEGALIAPVEDLDAKIARISENAPEYKRNDSVSKAAEDQGWGKHEEEVLKIAGATSLATTVEVLDQDSASRAAIELARSKVAARTTQVKKPMKPVRDRMIEHNDRQWRRNQARERRP